MSNILTGQIAQVKIGCLTIEGLLGSDNNYYIAVPQIADLFLDIRNTAARDIKRLLGEDFQTSKIKTRFNSKSVNAVKIVQFEEIVARLDRKGNKKAQDFRDALIGLSLTQLFCDAFGQKFDAADRQQWLKARLSGKETRRTLTDAIADYITNHPELSPNTKKYLYLHVSDTINVGLFNRKASKLKDEWVCNNPRDGMNAQELKWIEQIEDLTMRLIDGQSLDPIAAAKQAIANLFIPVVKR